MRNALGVTSIEINRSSLDTLWFDDIQSVVGLTSFIDDTFSDVTFNDDATALVGNDDSLDIVFQKHLSMLLPAKPLASSSTRVLLTLMLTSRLSISNPPAVAVANVLDALEVGSALSDLNITGDVDLQVLPDIGVIQLHHHHRCK